MDCWCRFLPLSGSRREQKEIKNETHFFKKIVFFNQKTLVFPLEVGGNVTPAAGLRRSAPGWQGERAPCRTPRGALPPRPGGSPGSITSRSHSGRGSASAHTPAPTALRPRSTAPRCPRADPSRGGGPGWAPFRGRTACHPARCGGAHLVRASLC